MYSHRYIPFPKACEFVAAHHRHHKPPQGHVVSIGMYDGERLVGIATIGRPVARMLGDGTAMEITRLCVLPGVVNGCSWLATRAKRVIHALGCRAITYTLQSESGASLRAAGFKLDGPSGGGTWSRPSRERCDTAPLDPKWRWSA